jgi:F-type H+-transporting ATPase subunit epsilon
MATLRLEIVTPDAKIYSSDVDMVVVPGIEGELGILPHHVPLMTQLQPGELKISKFGEPDTFLAVGDGFVEVTGDRVSVMTDMAIEEKGIDEAAAQAAVERAQQALRQQHMAGEEVAAVQAALEKSLAQLRVKRRRRAI